MPLALILATFALTIIGPLKTLLELPRVIFPFTERLAVPVTMRDVPGVCVRVPLPVKVKFVVDVDPMVPLPLTSMTVWGVFKIRLPKLLVELVRRMELLEVRFASPVITIFVKLI